MTRQTARKPVNREFAESRLRIARAFHKAARLEAASIQPGEIGNAAMSQIILAALAYADALSARYGGYVNQKDHAAAVQTLRDALGKRLPTAQETVLARILGRKDEVQYGIRLQSTDDARSLLDQLDRFATWAEAVFVEAA